MRTRPRLVMALAMFCAAGAAEAANGPDLTTTIVAPTGTVRIGDNARYVVRVFNRGNRNAGGVSLSIQLPVTSTSPGVHIQGDLGVRDSRCSVSGTRLVCALGTLNRNRGTDVFFDIALPYSTAPTVFSATATTAGDPNPGDNSATYTATLAPHAIAINPARQTFIQHCTGTGLTSYYACELYPSAVSSHETVLNPDHSITFLNAPAGFTGTWSQPAPDRLRFQYFEQGTLVATFEGYGADAVCFEGPTTFPNSSYISMYQVCLR